jgi:hypothetical protein
MCLTGFFFRIAHRVWLTYGVRLPCQIHIPLAFAKSGAEYNLSEAYPYAQFFVFLDRYMQSKMERREPRELEQASILQSRPFIVIQKLPLIRRLNEKRKGSDVGQWQVL